MAAAPSRSEKLERLVRAVCETGKKGKLTIVLEVKPSRVAMGAVTDVEIVPTITITRPEPSIGSSVFFTMKDENGAISGALSRHDPNQMSLLKELEKENTE